MFNRREMAGNVQKLILETSRELVDDAITLTDAISPPDFILNSVLGHSSGNIYDLLAKSMNSRVTKSGRPDYWQDLASYYNKSKM